MTGANLADEVTTGGAVRGPGAGRDAVPRRGDRPRHQVDDAAPDGRARHRGARAAGDRDHRRGPAARRRTGSSSPTAPATRRPPTGRSRCCKAVLEAGIPYFGICFGNQLFGRALGFGTYKLTYGHRGINQPVMDLTTRKVEITAHNHGFAVDAAARGRDADPVRASPGSATSASTTTWSRVWSCATPTASCSASRCSTTPRRPPARTTPPTCSTGSSSVDGRVDKLRPIGRGTLMPRRTDITSILVIGSGPIVIGQACEFDYSGTQACRVLRGGGLPGHPGQLQPGHDHDRPGVRRRHLHRADHPGVRRAGDRHGAARRPAGHPRRADRAERRRRAARERRPGAATASS